MNENKKGHIHIITQAIDDIIRIMADIGFSAVTGPEAESGFYNFDALNFPKDHPARDMQDTFWLKSSQTELLSQNVAEDADMTQKDAEKEKNKKELLRTHTSPVQIRYLETHKPPCAIIVPGKVYRNEATDATHEAQFYQVEGLLVAEKVSMADLKGTLLHLLKGYFGSDTEIIMRPSFFPFVEPGVEVAMKWKGRTLEMMGAGLIHPNVLRAAGVDPEKYQGFAFGGGIDRMVMLKYGIDDIRMIYNGDLRLVNQF